MSKIKNGDKIRIEFEFEIKINEYQGGVFVERGHLLYALGMKGERMEIINKDVSNTLFPAYSIYPNKDWNFGINIQNAKPNVVYYNRKVFPWDMDNSPIEIELNVYKIPSWNLIHKKRIKTTDYENRSVWYYRKGDFTFTPPIPKDVSEISSSQRLVLYPFGMCKLRISVFPVIKDSKCKGFENE